MIKSKEEELRRIIRIRGTSFSDYLDKVINIDDINSVDCNKLSFLHEAISSNREDIAEDLLERGINVNIQDVNKNTAVSYAAANKKWKMLDIMLDYGVDLNIKLRHGNSLLWNVIFASSSKDMDRNKIIKKLLCLGANPLSKNENGYTPLSLVMDRKDYELIELLEKYAKQKDENEFVENNSPNIHSIEKKQYEKYVKVEKYAKQKEEKEFGEENLPVAYIIDMRQYEKYIIVENVPKEYISEKIKEYTEIAAGSMVTYKFAISSVEDTKWQVVSCPNEMDFYNYHNLMSWFWGTAEDKIKPSQNICVALNEDKDYSYYGVIDDFSRGDTLIGRFQYGGNFSIYLPAAFVEGGNAIESGCRLSEQEIDRYLDSCGFNKIWLQEINKFPYLLLEVSMAT